MVERLIGWTGLLLGFSGLIFIHELGHFLLAKWNRVRVHVFSIGMGPYLFSFTWHGTIYALSLIPIGGYVKMMGQDDMNPSLDPSKDPSDYRNKRPGQKAAILAAGAVFNIIFMLIAFTFCYKVGMDVEPPRIGTIQADKPLAFAELHPNSAPDKKAGQPARLKEGERILEVGGTPVKTFLDAFLQIASTPSGQPLLMEVLRLDGKRQYVVVNTEKDQKLGAAGIGLNPYVEPMKLNLGFATSDVFGVADEPGKDAKTKNSPAAVAGLKEGDEIVSVDNKPIKERIDFVDALQASRGSPISIVIRRNGEELTKKLTPKKSENGKAYMAEAAVGIIKRQVTELDPDSEAAKAGLKKGDYVYGFTPDQPNAEKWKSGKLMWGDTPTPPDPDKTQKAQLQVLPEDRHSLVFVQQRQAIERYQAATLGEAIGAAWDDAVRFSLSVFAVLRGLLTGGVSSKALSGPGGIAGMMYTVASQQTFMKYLWFLGFISLNLGVMQFIPIPLLDGFHLVMVLIEKLKGSPVAPKVQEVFQYAGIFIVGGLLLLATYNDISRHFFPNF